MLIKDKRKSFYKFIYLLYECSLSKKSNVFFLDEVLKKIKTTDVLNDALSWNHLNKN
ncbi:hypothetical protein pah_c197o077 [Parachlamydia acanthamoebae str. Hall's coccus]|nr:hypothetical protein pah_c197o077 [Parachlamydia acanthamoebae str. Hall's coccus]